MTPRLRNEDFARGGAMTFEDLGVIEIDRLVGNPSDFGARLRKTLCGSDGLINHKWAEVASRVSIVSPGTSDPTMMLMVLCQLAAAELFIDGDLRRALND